VADWFYAPSWRRLPPARPVDAQSLAAKRRSWLVFADEQGLGTTLAERLGQAGQIVTQVVRGSGFARRADGTYAIDPRQREDYDKLLLELTAQGAGPEVIVHLWSVLPGPVSLEHALDVGFYSLLYLAQALGKGERKEPLALWVAANDVHKVESADRPWPEKATLLGPCRVIPQEVPQVTCRFVDVALGRDGGAAGIAGALLGEIVAPAEEAVVALRGAQRWAQRFEPLRLTGEGPPARSLHERGVYLIVDGLAGIGQVLAEDLARTYKARLILIEGTESSGSPAAQGAEASARRQRRQVQALEASGAEVLVVRANPTNEDEMRRAVAAGRERFGDIDGVFYAAGGMQGATLRTLQETRPADCAWHFAHQIHGLQVLAWVLPSEGLDFCCLTSSLSALLGGLGQVAHAAASHFMDAFAESRNERGAVSWISVDWDAWQFPREDGQPAAALSSTLAQFAIQPAEGREVMRRLLTQAPVGQIVVSTADLEARQRHWEEIYRAQGQGQGPKRSEATRAGHARPALGTPYLAPRSDLEQAIAAVWQQVLGMAEVGVNDNFFELGGHSLLATQLRNHLHEVVRVDLPLRDLFDKPTVAGVAELVEKHRAQQAAAQEKPIRERLRVAFPTEKQAILEEYLHKKIAAGMRLGVDELPRDGSLRQFDLHLLGAELEYDLRQDFKFQLFPHEVQEHPTIPSLARYLLAEMDRQADPTRFLTDRPLSDYKLRPYRKHVTVAGGAGTQAAQGKNPSMVFVHSSPRAGSTLFRVMLAGHPQLFCPPEVNLLFFDNLQEWRQNIGFGHEMEWTTGGLQWAFMELLGIDSAAGQALIDKMLSDNVSAQHVYGRLQELCRPRLLVDKTPSYSLDLETIWRAEAMFDAPKYIYLYRHPYPVMESILRVRFDRLFGPSLFGEVEVDPYVVAETVWALSNRNLLTFFERIGRERCLWVRYEELVAQPEKVMTGVCAFLGIPFDERVLAPYDGKRERMMGGLGDPNLLQHNRIEPDLGEAWKRIKWPRPLDPSTRELVTRLGYEVPEVAPPPPRREAPPAPAAAAKAEELLANLDQLSDEQVAALLAEMSGEGEQ
jgi:NAD(P)-dependent dehydrogenase (short-subunit alcohol dehydrogenase family)/acyl carrier protein